MRTCPNCGRQVPPHVPRCPHDGTALGPPTGGRPDPPAADSVARPKQKPAREPQDSHAATASPSQLDAGWEVDAAPREGSSIRAWIGVLIASLVLLGGYGWARDRMLGPDDPGENELSEATADDGAKETRRKRGKRRGKHSKASGAEEYDEPVPTFEIDDREFGDLIAEGERERATSAAGEQFPQEVEPFDPPPEMYQPDGAYSPTASYAEPGARNNVITLDLGSGGGNSGPLDEAEVKKVLRVSALMPCYDDIVQKVPQMRGRVKMRFVIAADGHVMEATVVRSDLRSKMVESCIVERARRWRFPASGGQKTRFSTHFDFSSR